MAPAPLCKTEIISFIIDELILKLWNLSSNMRKRVQMILKNKDIAVKEYNEKALILNGWVRIAREDGKSILKLSEIKKGVSNYILNTQEELDKVSSLNTKLRCRSLDFSPKRGFEFDKVEKLVVNLNNYDFVSKCSFNRIGELFLASLSTCQLKEFISKPNQIDYLQIINFSLSNLDLRPFKLKRLKFSFVKFVGKVALPYYLKKLEIRGCTDFSSLSYNRVDNFFLAAYSSASISYEFISKIEKLREIMIMTELSAYIDFLPSSIRYIQNHDKYYIKDIDSLKEKFPFLIAINNPMSIGSAEKLNLRKFCYQVDETNKRALTFRPREITVNKDNTEQLNKHAELFEKASYVSIHCSEFNFDYLSENVKRIVIFDFKISDKIFAESLRRNNWKLEETEIVICSFEENTFKEILDCLNKVRKVKINTDFLFLRKIYPHLKIESKGE